jgi:hypothetical protein
VHEGGYSVRVSGNQQFEFTRPDGRIIEPVPKNSAEFAPGEAWREGMVCRRNAA